jgi:ELWxxDGT repeat protein
LTAFSGTGGWDLWKSDGTTGGTVLVKDFSPTAYSQPGKLTSFGGALYFGAWDGIETELWKSDGTTGGTTIIYDMNGSNSSNPSFLTPHGDLLYFQAYDDDNGTEMYFSDGTQAPMRIPGPTAVDYVSCDCYDRSIMSTAAGVFFTYYDATVGHELGFIPDPLPETNTTSNALTVALLVLSGALAAGAVIARRKELRAN